MHFRNVRDSLDRRRKLVNKIGNRYPCHHLFPKSLNPNVPKSKRPKVQTSLQNLTKPTSTYETIIHSIPKLDGVAG